MNTRREFLQTAAGLLIPSAVFADQFEFTPLPQPEPELKPKELQRYESKLTLDRYDLSDFRLDMHTESWCGPCQRWKKTEERRVDIDVQHVRSGGGTIPRFNLKLRYPKGSGRWADILRGKSTANGVDTGKNATHIQWTGYTSADKINSEVQRQLRIRNAATAPSRPAEGNREIREKQPPRSSSASRPVSHSSNASSKSRKTLEELRWWIRKNYTPKTAERHATVSPKSWVWNHLASYIHGFEQWQVRGLSQWEALALHSGRHAGQISPWRG